MQKLSFICLRDVECSCTVNGGYGWKVCFLQMKTISDRCGKLPIHEYKT